VTETRYVFWLYMLLVAGCIVTVAELLFDRSRAALVAASGLAAAVIAFYVLDRTAGLPNATSDIGNWLEPLGLASLVVEGFVVTIALGGLLAARGRAWRPKPQPARGPIPRVAGRVSLVAAAVEERAERARQHPTAEIACA
jgi:hypothetical protein